MTKVEHHATAIQDYHICPRLYKYRHNENLVPKVQSNKLFLGTGVHAALADYYAKGADLEVTFKQWFHQEISGLVFDLLPEELEEIEKQTEVMVKVLRAYVPWAKEQDPLDIAEVLHTEVEFAVPILNPDTGEETGLHHVGRLDAVVRDPYGRVWVMDHKTCSQFPNQMVLRLDEQMGYYLLAAHYLFPDYPIAGVLYNALKKTDPDRTRSEQFKRFRIIRNGYEITSIRRHLYRSVMEIQEDKYYEPQPGHHCSWRCPFTNLCIGEEDGSDVELLKAGLFDRKEPELILAQGGDES